MKKLLLLIAIILMSSCKSDQASSGYVTINGDVQGLKMGKVLLQMVQDSVLITLDSVQLDGTSNFTLSAPLEEPQLVILHLDVKDGTLYDDRVSIFAEDTVLTVTSTLNNFENDIKVQGSKNNDILDEFKENKKKLNAVYTDLVKRSMILNNKENPDPAAISELDNDYNKYLKKSVLYALNFADRHKDKEVAPYLIVTEAFDANPTLMDEVFQKMPKKIQTSYYGKQLSELIKSSKESNNL